MRQAVERLSDRAEFFVVIALCFGYFTVSSVVALVTGLKAIDMTVRETVVAILTEVLLLAAAVYVLRVRGKGIRSLGFRVSWGAVLAGVPLFVAWYVLYWITWVVVVSLHPAAEHLRTIELSVSAPWWLLLVYIVLNSVFEESAVAAYVVTALAPQGAGLAITASTLIRLAYHLYQGPVASIAILPLGLLFAAVYWKWRNVWPLICAHTISNAISFYGAEHGG